MAQRVQADFDNYRKRNASLRTEVADDTVRETIKEILPSLVGNIDHIRIGGLNGNDGCCRLCNDRVGS